jgi:cysteine desulfurase
VTPIYFDHNATTPLDAEVRAEMEACQGRIFGNPSSIHSAGQEAHRVIDRARTQVARLIGAQPAEIIFTSGGTEANNLAIFGTVAAAKRERRHVLTTAIEHQAVLNPCRHLEQAGHPFTLLPVDHKGCLDPGAAAAALRDDTAIVSVMLANNDTGVIQPVADIAAAARALGVISHTDAVQAVGKIPVNVNALSVDLLTFSAHKLHGPKGAGALYLRKGMNLSPLMFGGHQERSLRPGTENVAAIAGFGKACELASSRLEEDSARLAALRSAFEAAVLQRVSGVVVNGHGAPRLPNTSNISFEGLDSGLLAINLDLLGLAVSTGAACSSTDLEPSPVLLAMGRSAEQAHSSVRFSIGRGTSADEVRRAVELVCQAVAAMRRSAP